MEIIQIVPNIPPAISGVGDYAFLLAKELRRAHGVDTRFVVAVPRWENGEIGDLKAGGQAQGVGNRKSEMELDGFPVSHLRERSAVELLRVLNEPGMPQTVLLQYVGYGYEKRGCPVWLVRALRAWGQQRAKVSSNWSRTSIPEESRLVTMFHELYAFGPPWRSSFWTSLVQRWVAQSLARSSEHCFTNLRRNVPVLRQMNCRPEENSTVMPVFSNVGEPDELPDWNGRLSRMVVFGSAGKRQEIYSEHHADLESACQTLGLNEIVDIGEKVDIPTLAVPVSQRGTLSPTQVSCEMLAARAGFFAYPTPYLGKSGVFAAYAAHGLVPITFAANTTAHNKDGLRAGEHFISETGLPTITDDQLELVSGNVRMWYARHTLREQTALYKTLLNG
jgi:hypothetical protein